MLFPTGQPSEPDDQRRQREQLIARFEAAWRDGGRPAIDEFLPTPGPERKRLLIELVHTDLEYRLKAGEEARVETYLERYPELAGDQSLALAMIAAECHFRDRRGTQVKRQEFQERSPHWQQDLHGFQLVETLRAGPIQTVQRWPAIAGYTILEEVGHGGMGVVYKARQAGLDRIVALKTIHDGAYAGPEAAIRFRKEAAAVARLHHPHIVQIYEIGDHSGRPYFSLEFVAGGNLAQKIAGAPIALDEAAALVEALARAIQHAHQQGIIHRDLKPANVLLTEEGTPKVTDFGLAKWMEGGTHHTRTGAILGTPAYMAPEQASGRTADVGPATDIHALGAILYELLTGSPPFQGKMVAEVLEQVRSQEVHPPSRLRSKLPRDLETICLKALAKEPKSRYHSALALAQDLERFRNGEPILARRQGIARKLWRKARRNPVVVLAGLAAALAVIVTAVVAPRAQRDRQIVALVKQIDDGLREDDWSPNHVKRLDALIADLHNISPEGAALADRRLRQQWAESVRQRIRDSHDRRQTIQILEAFAARDPAGAQGLREEYGKRVPRWRPLFELTAPFSDLGRVFDPVHVRVEKETRLAPAATSPVLTRTACRGNVELKAEFDSSWESAPELALLLNSQGGKGYAFRLRPAASSLPSQISKVRKASQDLRMQIWRNGVLLREGRIPPASLASGPLRLEAKREGDRLTFQVNQLAPLEFREVFPLADRDAGLFGVQWAPGAGLVRLRADSQNLPLLPSPLEQGDDWFARGDYRQAREFYRQQSDAALRRRDNPIFQEATYKEGLCLIELNRPTEEAIRIFQEVAGAVPSAENLWPLRADCQLLQIYLDRQEAAPADAILEKLSALGSKDVENLVMLIPEEVRSKLELYWTFGRRGKPFRSPADAVRDAKRLVQMKKLFDGSWENRFAAQMDLVRAYRLADLDQKEALPAMEELLRTTKPSIALLEEYCWLLRTTGKAAQGLGVLEKALAEPRSLGREEEESARNLLVERARLHVALRAWDQAEADLEEFFCWHEEQKSPSYTHFSAACLMQGFLLERRQEPVEAQQAWRRGLPNAWREHLSGSLDLLGGTISLQVAILGSLTQQLSEADARRLLNELSMVAAGDARIQKVSELVRPGVLREMWRTPRGKEWARRIAFRDLSFANYLRAPVFLTAVEMLHQIALPPGPRDAAEDDLLWQLVEETYNTYLAGKIKDTEVIRLAILFRSTWAGAAGWRALTDSFGPRLRGPMAYVFGHRYLRGRKHVEAEQFFRFALADAKKTADARLGRFAQKGLDQSKK